MKTLSALALTAVIAAAPVAAQPTRDEALAAMKKAATFMAESVSYRGGYVWSYSEDLTRRWGEIPARPTQIWVQAGTPRVGMAFLDAHEATGDVYYLQAARKAADALIFGQHPLGGWHYFVDFDPSGLPQWYEDRASKFLYGYEEFRHYYGNATNDDQVTTDAAGFLLRLYATTLDAGYRVAVLKALDFALLAQYPNGAWPQRFPLRYDFVHDGLPDFTSYYTLNDGAHQGYVELLVTAYRTLGDRRYLDAARRGVDFLIAAQGPEGQAGWAEQYGMDMRPAAARTHEPAGYVLRESRDVLRILEMFYAMTGDPRYLAPIPRCLAWFERVNREAVELKRPPLRYWEVGSNRPMYNVRTGAFNALGYGLYKWTTEPPPGLGIRAPVDLAPIRLEYERVAAMNTEAARAAFVAEYFAPQRPRVTTAQVQELVESLDPRGAWVTNDVKVHQIVESGMTSDVTAPIRGISTAVFVANFDALTAWVKGRK